MENKEIIKQKEIEGTPFKIIEIEGEYFLTLGKYRLTQPMDKEEDVRKYLITDKWTLLLQMIEIRFQIEKEENKVKLTKK